MAHADSKTLLQALSEGTCPSNVSSEDWAVARESTDAAAVERLPPELGVAVVELSVRSKSPALALALARTGGPLSKAAKRALYQLKSLGVELPQEPAAPKRPQAPVSETDDSEFGALLSAVTGTGERGLLITLKQPGRGLEMFQFVFSDETGLSQLSSETIGRSAYRKQLKEVRGSQSGAIEVPREEGLRILAHAAGLNILTRSAFPTGAEQALRHLGVVARTEDQPALPEPLSEDARAALRGHTLHDEPEIAQWLPPEPQLRYLASKTQSILHSPLQLSAAQKKEQMLSAMSAAAREFLSPKVAQLYARRLWAMAEFFEKTQREAKAALARAEARRLYHGHNEPFSRFAEYLFEKVFHLTGEAMNEAGPGSHQAPPSQPPATQEKRSPGGLILP